MSVQDFIDHQRYTHGDNISFETMNKQLRDCVFFDRFQSNKCFSSFQLMPSFISHDQEEIYPEWLDKKYDEEEKTTTENFNF